MYIATSLLKRPCHLDKNWWRYLSHKTCAKFVCICRWLNYYANSSNVAESEDFCAYLCKLQHMADIAFRYQDLDITISIQIRPD